ncbi:MAG: MFS transporter [Verrucomicrobia subdivision 3 bacterium]|nr:MFS transporter [Limisphaerales bacterium]
MSRLPAAAESESDQPPLAGAHRITRRAITGWVLYDLANTIFMMGVISFLFPLWVRDEVGPARADARYGIISAISMGIIFLFSPLLGAMTDRARTRMPFLMVSTLICIALTALLGRGPFMTTAILFVVANIAYQASQQFYDALLPEVSTPENRGRIGGIGVGVGYLGSYIAIGLSLLVGTENKPRLFTLYAIAFLVFSIPCVLFVKERGNPTPRPINFAAIMESLRGTYDALRHSQKFPGLLRFLVGRVFYTDAINTVINIMVLYTVNVAVAGGLDKAQGEAKAQIIMLFAITFAIAGGFAWGWLADKIGPRRTLHNVLYFWMGIFVLAALVGMFKLPLFFMFVVAGAAGFAMGGVWAADRPFMLRLTPPHRIGEFYGLYGMVGRFSAITGPIVWAAVTSALIKAGATPLKAQGFAVLVLLALVLISYAILRPVSDNVERRAEPTVPTTP